MSRVVVLVVLLVALLGVEGPGLPQGLTQILKIGIPIAARVESLNAAVATAITLYDWQGKRPKS